MKLSILVLTLGFAAPSLALNVKGVAQLWQKKCREQKCGLPESIGKKQSWRVDLKTPTRDREVSVAGQDVKMGSRTARITYFWAFEKGSPRDYISVQVQLFESGKLLVDYGQYRSLKGGTLIPVGYGASPIVRNRQIGISFSMR